MSLQIKGLERHFPTCCMFLAIVFTLFELLRLHSEKPQRALLLPELWYSRAL